MPKKTVVKLSVRTVAAPVSQFFLYGSVLAYAEGIRNVKSSDHAPLESFSDGDRVYAKVKETGVAWRLVEIISRQIVPAPETRRRV